MFQVYFSTIPVTERIKLFIPCDKSCFKLLRFSMNKLINPSDWLTNEDSVKTNLIKPNDYLFFIFTFFNLKFFWINSRNFSSFKNEPISVSLCFDLLTNQKSTLRFETKKNAFWKISFSMFFIVSRSDPSAPCRLLVVKSFWPIRLKYYPVQSFSMGHHLVLFHLEMTSFSKINAFLVLMSH